MKKFPCEEKCRADIENESNFSIAVLDGSASLRKKKWILKSCLYIHIFDSVLILQKFCLMQPDSV